MKGYVMKKKKGEKWKIGFIEKVCYEEKRGILKLGYIERICYEEERVDTKVRKYWKEMLWGRKGEY